MSYDAIGRRYARAIFEIGKEEGNTTQLAEQIRAFADTYASSAELRDALENPLVSHETRGAIVVDVAQRLGASATAQRALRLITRQRRLRAITDVARQLERFVDDDAKVIRAEVMSAAPLGDAFLAKLRAELERATGNKVVLAHTVDPSLIGGIVTRLGDRVIDGSLRSRLKGFREAIFN